MEGELKGTALTFGSDKRLKSRKKIERLFATGQHMHKFPIRAVYLWIEEEAPGFQIAVSVPKKLVKKASNRNLIKRRMREAFRLHQFRINYPKKLEIMFIYTTSELLEFSQIEKSMIALLDSLSLPSNDKNEGK